MTGYEPKDERWIDTGRGVCMTRLTPAQIAARRARLIDSISERSVFVDTFTRTRAVAVNMPDLDLLWTLAGGSHVVPVIEAAMIEALASLRAEGKLS